MCLYRARTIQNIQHQQRQAVALYVGVRTCRAFAALQIVRVIRWLTLRSILIDCGWPLYPLLAWEAGHLNIIEVKDSDFGPIL